MPITSPDQISYIDFEISSHCNLHCPQCARFDRDGFINKHMTLAHLNFDSIDKHIVLDELTNLQTVKFEGDHGEPLMHPDVDKFLNKFTAAVNVELTTNGSLRSQAWWTRLATKPNLTVTFSIDGLKDTNHIYRINADFDKIIDNASTFIKAGGKAIWKFVVFDHNQHQLAQAQDLSKQMRFVDFQYIYSNRNFYDNNEWPIMVDGEYQGQLKMASAQLSVRQHTKTIAWAKSANESFAPPTCSWSNRGHMYVNHRGHLLPCCMTSGHSWRKDISGQLWQKIVGDAELIDLHHHTLTEILRSDFYQTRLAESFLSQRTAHHVCIGNCSR